MLKIRQFLFPCIFFHKKNLIRQEGSIEYILYGLSFSHIRTPRWYLRSNTYDLYTYDYLYPIGSVPQLCRNRLEDVTYLIDEKKPGIDISRVKLLVGEKN